MFIQPDNKTPKKYKDLTNTLLEKVTSKRDDKVDKKMYFR